MASEFERTSQEVAGRQIVMTSWFDDSRQTWRASAPAYTSLKSVSEAAGIDWPSRKEALARLSRALGESVAPRAVTAYPRPARGR